MAKRKERFEGLEKIGQFPPVVYGLKGIMDLFGVGMTTASHYKNSFLKDAVKQKGYTIIVDTKKALELFGIENAEDYIMKVRDTDEIEDENIISKIVENQLI